MIVLDTNVVSELVRDVSDAHVQRWVGSLRGRSVCLTATVVAELYVGLHVMPGGRRKSQLAARTDDAVDAISGGRVLPFDDGAARVWATLTATRRRAGHPISIPDAQIAAVCLVHDATLATRNVRDFAGCGIHLVDPWEV